MDSYHGYFEIFSVSAEPTWSTKNNSWIIKVYNRMNLMQNIKISNLLECLQEKFLANSMILYVVFNDIEKVFDRESCSVVRWPLRKFGINTWSVRVIDTSSKVKGEN